MRQVSFTIGYSLNTNDTFLYALIYPNHKKVNVVLDEDCMSGMNHIGTTRYCLAAWATYVWKLLWPVDIFFDEDWFR